MVFCECKQGESAQKRFPEGLQRHKAVVFVVIGAITQGNEEIIYNSRRFLFIQSNGKDRLCF